MGLVVFTLKRVSLLAVRLLAFSYFNLFKPKKCTNMQCPLPKKHIFAFFFLSITLTPYINVWRGYRKTLYRDVLKDKVCG